MIKPGGREREREEEFHQSARLFDSNNNNCINDNYKLAHSTSLKTFGPQATSSVVRCIQQFFMKKRHQEFEEVCTRSKSSSEEIQYNSI